MANTNVNIFEQASRLKLRFETSKGSLSVEGLWTSGYEFLESLEQSLTEIVESYGKSTRRTRVRRTNEQIENELRLELVTYILNVKEQEADEAATAKERKENNQKVLALIEKKKAAEMENLSIEDLEKMLL